MFYYPFAMKQSILYASFALAVGALFSFVVTGCSAKQTKAPLALHWQLVANDVEPGICEAELTITNTSDQTLPNEGWIMGFGLMSLHPLYTEGDPIRETEVQASYHTIEPTETFVPLAAGESRTYKLRYKGSAVRQSSHPEGFFLVRKSCKENGEICEEQPVSIPCTFAPYTRKEQMMRGIETWLKTPYADGEYMYEYIVRLQNNTSSIKDDAEYDSYIMEPNIAAQIFPLPKVFSHSDGYYHPALAQLPRVIEKDAEMSPESYHIEVTNDTIWIMYGDDAGLFYANLTLTQLSEDTTMEIIHDVPDKHHRALMLDIVRNYYPMDSIMRVIEVMAALKLNVLHLHLADDEGWRIEIPALPQLTQNAGSRGYTKDEKNCLYPFYCGGWDANDKTSTANGYLTRDEYIRLVRYAGERFVRIIPEIDMPGHMRAIKKAMGDALVDPELEKREYLSAQNYTDNVIAVTRPEALPTMRTIIESFVDMHNEAGCPLTVFNIGGDEVPKGALTKEEHQTFIDGVLEILKEYNLQPAGWEEMTHFCPPESNAICYSWHNGYQKAQQMADEGYPVVLATANHLYFDFAYCHQHEEKGLNWGGYTDEFDAFDWQPLMHQNVMGISAQLWSEVIRSFSQVEWQIYPKMFGLSERAWNYSQSYLSVAEYAELVYGKYLPMLAEGKLHTHLANKAPAANFHLLQPGIHVYADNDGKKTVMMNTIYPAGEVRYTIELADGSQQSGVYTEPFALPADALRIKATWHYLDHCSNTTWLWINE